MSSHPSLSLGLIAHADNHPLEFAGYDLHQEPRVWISPGNSPPSVPPRATRIADTLQTRCAACAADASDLAADWLFQRWLLCNLTRNGNENMIAWPLPELATVW